MAVDKLAPVDPRVQHCFATLNGQSYHYLLGTPSPAPRATIFLIHGWPDFSYGWRNQIPLLLSMNLRVVVPDMMGYGLTAAPQGLEFYTMKRASDDMAALAKHLNAHEILILGHDWGGSVVFRVAMYHPKLIKAIISVCTPYTRPHSVYIPLETMVKTALPNFKYQLQLASGEVEKRIQTKEEIRTFLNGMYGGWGAGKKVGFIPEQGIQFDNLAALEKTVLMSDEELDYYAGNYARNGLRGTLNWYRVRELTFHEEKELAKVKNFKIKQPTLFISAARDAALPPKMNRGMEQNFVSLKRGEVDAGHWALWQKPEECNAYIKEFLEDFLATENKAKL